MPDKKLSVRETFRSVTTNKLSEEQLRVFPKIVTHEHADCSLDPLTLIELWSAIGFKTTAGSAPFPKEIIGAWQKAQTCKQKESVAKRFQKYIAKFAAGSLKNYVDSIVFGILPVMQTESNLYRIFKEVVESHIQHGAIAQEIRFAPQLHLSSGLTLDKVMQAVIPVVEEASIPISLIICALRHENGEMARKLANIAIKYKDYVSKFDLAGNERENPGILDWWLEHALRAREEDVEPTLHLWETEEPTDKDLKLLDKHNIKILGHGIRGRDQLDRICTVCVTSNVVTGQIASVAAHPIDQLYKNGAKVTIETDGTLLTNTNLTKEYSLLQQHFGWGKTEFLTCNLTAVEQLPFNATVKQQLRAKLIQAYS